MLCVFAYGVCGIVAKEWRSEGCEGGENGKDIRKRTERVDVRNMGGLRMI